MRKAASAAPLLLLLAGLAMGCGGGRATEEALAPEDGELTRTGRAARTALDLGRAEEAMNLYAQALERARERDDARAIADAGIGQATAALQAGEAERALRVAREVRAELARRDDAGPPTLLLLTEATALYRLERPAEAEPLAEAVVARRAEDPPSAARAAFLIGLIADGRRDASRLAAARAAMAGVPGTPDFRADAAELDARLALLRRDAATARRLAAEAAEARQEAVDYRGLTRALELQGNAARQAGDLAGAADLMLRAGRGAAARNETREARRLLTEAASLAREAGGAAGPQRTAAEAREALEALRRSEAGRR